MAQAVDEARTLDLTAADDEPLLAPVLGSPAVIGVVGVLLLVAHLAWGAEQYPVQVHVLAAVLGTTAHAAIFRTRRGTLPFIAVTAAYYYIYYGFAAFWDLPFETIDGPMRLSDESLTLSVGSALLVLVLMILASAVATRAGQLVARRYFPVAWPATGTRSGTVLRAYTLVSFAVAVATSTGRLPVPLPLVLALGVLIAPAIVQTLLFSAAQRDPASGLRVWLWTYTLLIALLGFSKGILAEGLFPLLNVAILMLAFGRKIKPWPALAIVFVFAILQPAKAEFRRQVWSHEASTEFSFEERLEAWGNAFSTTYGATGVSADEATDRVASRVSYLQLTAQCFEMVPNVVPHKGVAGWVFIPALYVPRIIWESKPNPTVLYNVNYTLTFGLQSELGSRSSTMTFPLIAEGYWYAGWPGVVFAGLVAGLLLGLYQGAFGTRNYMACAVGLSLLSNLDANNHLAGLFGGLLQVLVGSFTVLFAVDWASRDRRAAEELEAP